MKNIVAVLCGLGFMAGGYYASWEIRIEKQTQKAEDQAYFYHSPGFAYKFDQALGMGVVLARPK